MKINKPRTYVVLALHILCSNGLVMRLGERGKWTPSMSDYKDQMAKAIKELGVTR